MEVDMGVYICERNYTFFCGWTEYPLLLCSNLVGKDNKLKTSNSFSVPLSCRTTRVCVFQGWCRP